MLGKVNEDLISVLRAGYSHIYIQTTQMDYAMKMMVKQVSEYRKGDGSQFICKVWSLGETKEDADPRSALDKIDKAESGTVYFLKNFNWVLDSRSPVGQYACDMIQKIQNDLRLYRRKNARKVMIIVSSRRAEEGLPQELRNDFISLKFERPGKEMVGEIFDHIVHSEVSAGGEGKYTEAEKELNLEAAKGMDYYEIEDAFSYSLVKRGKIEPQLIHSVKAQMLEKVAGIEYGVYPDTFKDLLGYEVVKQFCLTTIPSPLAKGILLVGPPGCGKSSFCKCLGNETGLPVLQVEIGNLFGSLLGETYERVAALIDVIKAMGRCIVFFDEMEKGMAGMSGNGGTTGTEVTVRAMAMILKYMSEPRESYIIATVNNIDAFENSPEYLRAERWDCAPFYIGLPNVDEKKAILDHYKKVFGVDGKLGAMVGWSGAEIKAACRIAKMMNAKLDDVKQFIIPITQILGKKIKQLEEWSEHNAIQASIPMKVLLDRDLDMGKGKKHG